MGLDFLPVCDGRRAAGGRRGRDRRPTSFTPGARRRRSSISVCSSLPTFRASIFGGFLFRLGIGALPFLLPLLLQIGFDLTPFQSGLITFTSALGSMFMKAAVAQRAATLRLPAGADLQQPDQRRFPRRLRELRARHAVLGDDRHPARRRFFSLAAIHRHQHHRLCGDRTAPDKPGDDDRRGRPATGAVNRRRGRRACGRGCTCGSSTAARSA